MFYWSEENFRIIEEELECTIIECFSFTRNLRLSLEHGSFATDDGRFFYVHTDKKMDFFHVYETDEMVYEGYMLYKDNKEGKIDLYNKQKNKLYKMTYVTDVALEFYEDVEPEEMRLKDTKQVVIVGKEMDKTEGLFQLQKYDYEKGRRTVWIDDYTRKHPIIIGEDYDEIYLPDRLLQFIDDINDVSDKWNNESDKEYKGIPVFSYKIEFVYEDRYYIMLPSATDMTETAFCYIDELINRYLLEMGCPYVRTYTVTTDAVGSD